MVNKKKNERMGILKHSGFFFVFRILMNIILICSFFLMLDSRYCYGVRYVGIGAVLDTKSTLGIMADFCMRMAISDFYAANQNYSTRLQLNTKNSNTLLDAHFAVQELVEKERVEAILGPQGSKEVALMAEIGAKVEVPIISFTATTSALSYTDNRYFVRATHDDKVQAQALAAICKNFEWPQVLVLYENTDYGTQFVSLLNNAFQDAKIGFIYMLAVPTLAEDSNILKELKILKENQTRVFLVHMNPSLGYRLFRLAKTEGMMSEGYAWIITDSLSNFMNSMDFVTRDSMEGVVGIRPYVSPSRNLEIFQEKWKRNMILKKMSTGDQIMDLNIYGLWAYDAVTALAIAVENIAPTSNTQKNPENFGTKLVDELTRTKFRGLSGEFELFDGKLKGSAFEIFNVMGRDERRLGFWAPGRGIIREFISSTDEEKETLKRVIWPGDSVTTPKGWPIPANGNLRVGVPWKQGFNEFVNVTVDPTTNLTSATGFSVDIFLAAKDLLPFNFSYKFLNFNITESKHWYNSMLKEIPNKTFDMVVGDTTIWAPRAAYVDFSLPYSESGVILVVKNKKTFDMWIFVKPLNWDLWLAIIVACLLMGVALYILERGVRKNSRDSATTERMEKASGTIYLSSVAILAFPDRSMVSNNWSSFVLVFWLFMAFILMQSYTANLSAILTVDQLNFAFSDRLYVGYQKGSFMEEFLANHFNISPSRLKNYSSAEEFHDAMTKGGKNGGIDVIFDEVPYMQLLLKKYASQYKMVGPIYKTGGFGFAFPVGSPLAAYFSRAILNVTQGPNMNSIEQRNFGPGYSSQDPLSSTFSQGTPSLTFLEFAGLFIIVGSVTIFALLCSETLIGRKLTEIARNFMVQISCSRYKTSRVLSMEGDKELDEVSTNIDGGQESHESSENTRGSPPPAEGSNSEITEAVPQQGEEDIAAMINMPFNLPIKQYKNWML